MSTVENNIEQRLVSVRLGALTRVEWYGVISVPKDTKLAEVEETILEAVYDTVDGGDYQDDSDYWEKGLQWLNSEDVPAGAVPDYFWSLEEGIIANEQASVAPTPLANFCKTNSMELSFVGRMSGDGECFGFADVDDSVLQLVNGTDYADPEIGLGKLLGPTGILLMLLGDKDPEKRYRFTLGVEEIAEQTPAGLACQQD